MRAIDDIIIHCTDTPEGRDVSVDEIRRWHVKGNGWADIGYHYVIYRDGSVHEGRPVEKAGAHCKGHNGKSLGVVYVGGRGLDGKPRDTRTPEQREALRRLVAELRRRWPGASVHGHRDYAAKACPCFNVHSEL